MMVGALVLPVVTVGITEASITRRPAMPTTRSRGSTTAIGSVPILQVPTGWKIVVPLWRGEWGGGAPDPAGPAGAPSAPPRARRAPPAREPPGGPAPPAATPPATWRPRGIP